MPTLIQSGATGPGLLTFGGPTGLVAAIAPDLMAAVVAWLRADPAVVAALGDSGDAPKIWADNLVNLGTPPPYLAYSEAEEDNGPYQSPDAAGVVYSFPLGRFVLTAAAGGKQAARDLGRVIADALHDAPLVFGDGAVLEIRMTDQASAAAPAPGPGATTQMYLRALTFTYRAQRSFPSSR